MFILAHILSPLYTQTALHLHSNLKGNTMKATINNSLIAKLKPSEKQYEVHDTKLAGFLIRVNPSGKMNYVCVYKRGQRVNLGKVGVITPAQARDRAKEIIGDAAKGLYPTQKNDKDPILLHFYIENEYRLWIEAHRKAAADTLSRIIRCFCKPFGNKQLTEITPLLIEQWRTKKLKSGCSTSTVNRDIATFKAALSKAVEWGFITTNPLASVKLLKEDRAAKVRYLTPDEEEQLRKALCSRDKMIREARERANIWRKERKLPEFPHIQEKQFTDNITPMVLISLNTGLRRGELFSLHWEDVNFGKGTLTINGHAAKSGKTRHIPLNKEAMYVLVKWQKQTSSNGLVFPNRKSGNRLNNVTKAWKNTLKLAQIQYFRWHDLRHHFASKLVMSGVDLNTVRELLGHSDLTMTLRYAHLAPEHKAQAVERLVSDNFRRETGEYVN